MPKLSALELEEARDKRLRDLKVDFLGCRDMRHSWNRKTAKYASEQGGVVRREIVCRDCGMEKTEWFITRTGERDGIPHYKPPTGYYTRGLGRFFPAEIRREEFRRRRFKTNGG